MKGMFKGHYTIPLAKMINQDYKVQSVRLMTMGPVNTTPTVKMSTFHLEVGHREPEFEELYKEIKAMLLKAFGVSPSTHDAVVINGSGTTALETVIKSTLSCTAISLGYFGDRLAVMCPQQRKYLSIKEKAIAIVHLETSTGELNPLQWAKELCKKKGRLLIVDAMSSFAVEPIDMADIDFVVSSTNKGLGGLPVLSFVVFKKSAGERLVQPHGVAFNLLAHIEYGKRNQTPFTPQIPLFLMLRQALEELLYEGVENRIKRYRKNTMLMRKRLKELGLKFQLWEEWRMCNGMTNVLIPKGFTYQEIHDGLKDKEFIIYPGKEELEGRVMHIANIGTLTVKDVEDFIKALKEVLKK